MLLVLVTAPWISDYSIPTWQMKKRGFKSISHVFKISKWVNGTAGIWIQKFHCNTQVYNDLLSQRTRCHRWNLGMPKRWDEMEKVEVRHTRQGALCEQRFWGALCLGTLRNWVRLEWSWEKGCGQFVILILQTFLLTSKPTLKGRVLLASILVTT